MIVIDRKPFAREDLMREVVNVPPGRTCDWCDQPRRYGARPVQTSTLFRYGVWRDGINTRVEWNKGLFCSRPCHNTYHGI